MALTSWHPLLFSLILGILEKQYKVYIYLALSISNITAITFRLLDKLLAAIFKPFGCVKEIARKEIEAQQ